MHKNNLTLIRPMVFIEESQIRKAVAEYNFPVIKILVLQMVKLKEKI